MNDVSKIYYVMRGNEIIFHGCAADCLRIRSSVPDSRIEPNIEVKK